MLSERAAWEKEMGSAIARVKAEMGESVRGHGAMQAGHTRAIVCIGRSIFRSQSVTITKAKVCIRSHRIAQERLAQLELELQRREQVRRRG